MFAQNARLFGLTPSQEAIDDLQASSFARTCSLNQLLAERKKQIANSRQLNISSLTVGSESSKVVCANQLQTSKKKKKQERIRSHSQNDSSASSTSDYTFPKGRRWNAEVLNILAFCFIKFRTCSQRTLVCLESFLVFRPKL